ncbi:UNVERIFIED_CONTAM: hypothetical protein Slati_4282900 [Sesamum latifolium]|uniref:Retrovirus-related Pol polyprotein from transposon TNT 1-94-like beta-barrel domain-containing protein n=1 Tax=Sesamum latifolium TaxID=2727402 RepID=A0AAW2TCP1_9LAMI
MEKNSTSTSLGATQSSFWVRTAVSRFAVEIFDGTGHFGMWQSEVLDTLFQQGLDFSIEKNKPDDMEEKDWNAINRLACGTIRSCLSREQRYSLAKETSAYKLWTALEEKFLKKNCQNKLHMKKRLFRFSYVSGTTMNDHITNFNKLVTDLLNMDEKFKDEDLALMLLGSLLEEFEVFETTLLNGKDVVSLREVCVVLYSYELRKKERQANLNGDTEALIVRGHSQNRSKGNKGRSKSRHRLSKDECAFYREKGHWKKDCPKLKGKGKSDKNKSIAESNIAEGEENSDFSLAILSIGTSDLWVLGSACSHHMCPYQDWFFDYKELNGGVVYTANDISLTTYGIGSIRLKNQDGSVITLTGVRYVSELRKNLISVGTLESKGFEVRAKDGVMKIISGARVVMKGSRKNNNLYQYLGRTVIGTAAATSTDDRESEEMKLSHMRLGHAGEKSLNVLINKDY